jgi:hypothetical protein
MACPPSSVGRRRREAHLCFDAWQRAAQAIAETLLDFA